MIFATKKWRREGERMDMLIELKADEGAGHNEFECWSKVILVCWEEEDNQVTNVQNVRRWLNKIPPQPNLQRNPGQNSIFPQEERVFAQMASYLSNLDNLSMVLNLFFPASSFYSSPNIFDVNTFQYSLTQALNVVGRYKLHQVNFFAIIGPNQHVFKLCFAFSDEKMMMQKCISAAGLFPSFLQIPRKIGRARSRCDTAIRHK